MMQWMYRSFRMSALLCCFAAVSTLSAGCGDDDEEAADAAIQSDGSAEGSTPVPTADTGTVPPVPPVDGSVPPLQDASQDVTLPPEDSGYDAGVDSGTVVDAGVDTGVEVDAGTDAGVEVDSGYDAGQDSGVIVDAGVDTGVDSGSDAGNAPAISCSAWTRNTAFDALTINGYPVDYTGRIWGLSDNDLYVPIGYRSGASLLAHWDGNVWTTTALPGTPSASGMTLWGSSPSDIWASGYDPATGWYLAHNQAGVWSIDPNPPAAKGIGPIWGIGTDTLYVAGVEQSTGNLMIWKRSGSSWLAQTLPALPDSTMTRVSNIWGTSSTNVFAGATQYGSAGGTVATYVLAYDGIAWKVLNTPSVLTKMHWILGSSPTDAFISGVLSNGNYALYRATGTDLVTWTMLSSSASMYYGTIVSPSVGNAIIASEDLTAGARWSAGRISLVQAGLLSAPVSIGTPYRPYSIWRVPGTSSYHFSYEQSIAQTASFYSGTCN